VRFLFRWQFDGFQKATKEMLNHKKGTTTLAFIFDKGVIVAADSRASMGGYICERPGPAKHGFY
jgi:20S proteasome alpha/beta subunit